ncbi:hypothetical protein [Coraliomargarita parva]|uniref:hypothetical protein n=1 Tax=Coraliomargarita parva TaxID=3014050 RepID=UPI0022B488DF|nr:hypothetical protein [Coraliomargarita parva]
MISVFKTIALLILALLLTACALLVPAHLRTLDPDVLSYVGSGGLSPEQSIQAELDAAYIGPAKRMAEALDPQSSLLQALEVRELELLDLNPGYAISGGPDSDFEAFLHWVQRDRAYSSPGNGVLSLLLARNERSVLLERLQNSKNANVTALLEVRDMPGLLQLHPASHAAGAPYDAAILTLAQLIDSGHFQTRMAGSIGQLARSAADGNPAAVRSVEALAIATLSVARQLDYRSLVSLAEISDNLDDWNQIAGLFRTYPEQVPLLYTALRFAGTPGTVFDYIVNHPSTALNDLQFSMREGPDALQYLLEQDHPVFKPRGTAGPAVQFLSRYRPEWFTALTAADASTGLLLKFGFMLCAGFAFSLSMGAAWRASFKRKEEAVSYGNPAVILRDAFLGVIFALVVWTFVEPDVLKSKVDESEQSPRIEFAGTFTLDSIQSPVRIMQELNQVTLLVLALFFILQLVIYCFCLIKLREIAKKKLNPEIKLKLLENEENLFDFGLYVGLGGTVLSLILVAVGIVQASLMAAYASTLFGILFTAMLKVMNLRPYRRKLIMESGLGTSPAPAALMKDIEL